MAVIKSGPVDSIVFLRAANNASQAAADAAAVTVPSDWNSGSASTQVDSLAVGSTGLGIELVGDATAFDLSDETVGMAAGYDKNCLVRHQLNITLYEPNAWLLLNDAMRGNVELAITVNWSDGDTSTWNDARITVVPILNPIPNLVNAYYNANPGSDIDSAPTGFTSLGTVFIDQGATVTPNTIDDGAGKQLYASTSLEHIVELDFANWGSATFSGIDDGTQHTIAFELPDGQYFGYNRVYTEVRRQNNVGLEGIRTTRLRIVKGTADIRSTGTTGVLRLPNQGSLTGAVGAGTHQGSTSLMPDIPDCLFGLQIVAVCTGTEERYPNGFYYEA